jgi:hypothetical protein
VDRHLDAAQAAEVRASVVVRRVQDDASLAACVMPRDASGPSNRLPCVDGDCGPPSPRGPQVFRSRSRSQVRPRSSGPQVTLQGLIAAALLIATSRYIQCTPDRLRRFRSLRMLRATRVSSTVETVEETMRRAKPNMKRPLLKRAGRQERTRGLR